tara:strand:+ start:277 stop:804 length:528 start_codon:yes stop_codon:yes gene_type:complete
MGYIGTEPALGRRREVDDISGSFNGSTTVFNLTFQNQVVNPGNANGILISLGGVLQNPNTDYTIQSNQITFTTAPASGLGFWGLMLGQGIDTQSVADGVVTNASVSGTAAIAGSKIAPDFSSVGSVTARFMVIPKVTTTERNNLQSLVSGAFIYNTTLNKLQVYNGSAWETVTSS